jgi:dCMP deaminase
LPIAAHPIIKDYAHLIMNWDEYAIGIAEAVSNKSKDPWNKVGAVILREDHSIASVGYNGFPQGVEEDWSNRDERRKYVIHAEQNALRYIKPGEGEAIYSTLMPCSDCIKAIAAYKIKKVIYRDLYVNDFSAIEFAEKMGIELVQFKKPKLTSHWDHSTKPSVFIVKQEQKEIYRGTYPNGAKILGI